MNPIILIMKCMQSIQISTITSDAYELTYHQTFETLNKIKMSLSLVPCEGIGTRFKIAHRHTLLAAHSLQQQNQLVRSNEQAR